ncbi:hypothetical protein DBV15_02763 [Temnothorax longispinosus]|uniref:Uncharacterized protein n=1 Tax=Temnothorax longispinosus TaxID=300112 RepID=A0A4S2KG53_9HYME|nr:hypothetical protein DBV15_02763 [Temnothorax longispinosus]
MSRHLSSVGAWLRVAIKDKLDTETEWCTNVSRCSDRHCSMVREVYAILLYERLIVVTGRPDSAMAVLENISCNRCWIIDDVWHSILIDKSIFITARISPAASSIRRSVNLSVRHPIDSFDLEEPCTDSRYLLHSRRCIGFVYEVTQDCFQDVVQPVTASLKLSWTVTSPVGDAG